MRIERAVIDTNVLISAALSPHSAPAQIVDLLLEQATLVFSRATFDELETRLWRPKFDRYLAAERRRLCCMTLPPLLKGGLAHLFRACLQPCPNDGMFIHTALHGKAAWLISGDRDLLELEPVPGLEIRSPAQALEHWDSQDSYHSVRW